MSKKTTINCFLISWLVVLAIDAAPELGNWHKNLKVGLDAYLDVTGLWQGNWQLFAPEPDKINVAISADITFSDGTVVAWRSPDWRSQSTWQRFLSFREAEFIDNVRGEQHKGAWPTYADYIAKNVSHPTNPGLKPEKIVLTRHWADIPPPNSENVSRFPEVPPMDNSYIFFAKEIQP